MREKMSPAAIIIVVVVVALLFFVAVQIDNGYRKEIKEYVAARGGEVVYIEERLIDLGPFWYKGKHQHVYKAILKDGRTLWMRTDVFGYEWIWDGQDNQR